jgi:hypothetical protein
MKILYTGAGTFENTQQIAASSLGGYPSSSMVPNGALSNVFDTITKLTISRNKPEYRVLAILNDGIAELTGLQAWFEYPSDNSDESPSTDSADAQFRIAYAVPKVDACGDFYVDMITPGSKPYGVTFSEAHGAGVPLALPNLAVGAYLFIYLERTLDATLQQPLSDDELVAILNKTLILDTEEEVGLTFSWT